MIFSSEGYQGRHLQQYKRLLRLSDEERYKLDPILKDRLEAMGFDMTPFYPPETP